jgi:DNA-binding XRE family transcriptional regulator
MGEKQSRPETALVFGLWLRGLRLNKLNISLGKLAENLDVDPSTISAWETGQYVPSRKKLIELGNALATAGHEDCIVLWEKAGVDTGKLSAVWARSSVQPAGSLPGGPNQMVRVPLVQAGRDPAQVDAPGLTWDLPPDVVSNPASTLCACLTGGLFPFGAGDIFAVDNSASADLWQLCGSLVVVHFSRYPARLSLGFSPREMERIRKWSKKPDLPELEEPSSLNSGNTNAEELAERWRPDEHGTIGLEHIQAGWLRLQLEDDSDFAIFDDQANWLSSESRWRLVLQGAGIKGIIPGGGLTVPLTGWDDFKWRDHPPIRLQGNRILGRAIAWMPPAQAPESTQPRTKSRKDPK